MHYSVCYIYLTYQLRPSRPPFPRDALLGLLSFTVTYFSYMIHQLNPAYLPFCLPQFFCDALDSLLSFV